MLKETKFFKTDLCMLIETDLCILSETDLCMLSEKDHRIMLCEAVTMPESYLNTKPESKHIKVEFSVYNIHRCFPMRWSEKW